MDAALQPVLDFIARHHEWAALLLGLTTFLESLVIVGAFIPATALMLMAGGLIAAGALDPVSTILACVVGAVLGDAVSFSLGRVLGSAALRHPWLAAHRRGIALTRLVCRRYGIVTVFVGRFLGPLRALAPLVLGMLRMRRRAFQAANVVSALVWVPIMLAPGYLGAKGLAELEQLTEADPVTMAILAALAAVIAVTVGVIMWRRRARANARRVSRRAAAAATRSA